MNHDKWNSARKILKSQRRYTKPGEEVGAIAYLLREELCRLFDIPDRGTKEDDSPKFMSVDIRVLKHWFWDNFQEVLQPYYPNGHANGFWILSNGDTNQRAADSLAAWRRHQGEKELQVKLNKSVLNGTEFGMVAEFLTQQHKEGVRHLREIALRHGMILTEEEVEALIA